MTVKTADGTIFPFGEHPPGVYRFETQPDGTKVLVECSPSSLPAASRSQA